VNTVNDKVVKHSLVYLSVQNMVRGGRPLLPENFAGTNQPPVKMPISNQYSLVAPQPVSKKRSVQNFNNNLR